MKRKRQPLAAKNKSGQTPPEPEGIEPGRSVKKKSPTGTVDTPLRIIGGRLGGRKLAYTGDPRTRPMKERVREAVFNLVGPTIKNMQAIDLFAGTGALALESISRGAQSAVAMERHFPTADLIKQNGRTLEVGDQLQVLAGDTFIWIKRLLGGQKAAIQLPELSTGPWAVYCCPPYALYEERLDDLLNMMASFYQQAPSGSCLIVEADDRFDFSQLIDAEAWDVRRYSPAVIGMYRKP